MADPLDAYYAEALARFRVAELDGAAAAAVAVEPARANALREECAARR